jgi:hypothetical protein
MNEGNRFDFSRLETPLFQFVVVADSHDKLPAAAPDLEFPSRQYQHARVQTLLALIRHLPADFLIHMGDMVQEYPGTASFQDSFSAAVQAFKDLPLPVHQVAGNHDIGDKPDATMPTHPASSQSLAAYHSVCGRSWYQIDRADCCLLVINSQILDTGMAAETEQRHWLENALQAAAGKRIFLFSHLPLYLGRPDEPATGNYDVVGNRSRDWLLALIEKHCIRWVAGAHVHFAFFDSFSEAEYHQLASPCFTRPGFSHLFSSPPPPERGRNDVGKLGFYVVRVLPEAVKMHFIRTAGARTLEELIPAGSKIIVFPADGGHRGSPLGVTLREPILREVEVPIAFPSVVRQRVRNDYPFYNLREMGAAHLRAPTHDWADAAQRGRLRQLMRDGVSLTLFSLDDRPPPYPSAPEDGPRPEAVEWQLPGRLKPPEREFAAWVKTGAQQKLQTILAPVIPGRAQTGKQHPRTRVGYTPAEVAEINEWLRQRDHSVDRLGLDLRLDESPWEVWVSQAQQRTASDPAWDLKLEFASTDDDRNCRALAEAFALTLAIPGSRLLVDPLTDHDRTMDAVNGLCDTLHNPRPTFCVYRALNGIFFPESPLEIPPAEFTVTRMGSSLYLIESPVGRWCLVLDSAGLKAIPASWCLTTLWDLRRGQSRAWSDPHPAAFPYLISLSLG